MKLVFVFEMYILQVLYTFLMKDLINENRKAIFCKLYVTLLHSQRIANKSPQIYLMQPIASFLILFQIAVNSVQSAPSQQGQRLVRTGAQTITQGTVVTATAATSTQPAQNTPQQVRKVVLRGASSGTGAIKRAVVPQMSQQRMVIQAPQPPAQVLTLSLVKLMHNIMYTKLFFCIFIY